MTPIYLDYSAGTPVDRAVAAAMRPFHAALLGVAPEEIVFTNLS